MVSVIGGFHCIAVSYTQSACNLDFRLSARTAPWNKLCFQFPTSVSFFLKSQRNECCNTQCAMSKAARQVCLSVCLSAGRLVDMECPLPFPPPHTHTHTHTHQVEDFFQQAAGLHEEMECQEALRGTSNMQQLTDFSPKKFY